MKKNFVNLLSSYETNLDHLCFPRTHLFLCTRARVCIN